jgi:hypothetical protein
MILDIASEIVMFDPTINFGTAQDMAEAILNRIENEGMRPPVYIKRNENPESMILFVECDGWEV